MKSPRTILLITSAASIPSTGFSFGTSSFAGLDRRSAVQVRVSQPLYTDIITDQAAPQDEIVEELIPDVAAYSSAYTTLFKEITALTVSGVLPDDLVGTYYRSFPAMFSAGSIPPPKGSSIIQPKVPPVADNGDPSRMVNHPFEGDGAMAAITFHGNGTLTTRVRFVRTTGFTNERKKGKKLYSGMDGTRKTAVVGNEFPIPSLKHHLQPGLNKKRKNTSNTRPVYWAKKLLSLWEGGQPYKLDSLALSTEGRSLLGGVLKEEEGLGGKATYDSNRDVMLFYGNAQDDQVSKLSVYEFNSKFRLNNKWEAELPGFALLSDFAVSEKHCIFIQPKVSTNKFSYMTTKDPAKSLTIDQGEEAYLHLVPRKRNAGVKLIQLPSDGFSHLDVHFCNAFESDDIITLQVIRSNIQERKGKNLSWPWAQTVDEYADTSVKKTMWVYEVNSKTGAVSKQKMSDLHIGFGTINTLYGGRKNRFVYTSIGGMKEKVAPYQGIAKFDMDSGAVEAWMPEPHEFCGEPTYAPKSNDEDEDGGYILSLLYNGKEKQSEMVVLSARDIASGPIARLPIGVGVPHGHYGMFVGGEETNWSAEEIERRAKLMDKMEKRGDMWNEVKSDFSGLGLRLDDFEEYFGDLFS